MSTPQEQLASLGITLPTPAKPAANYVGYQRIGNQLIISGQIPVENGSYKENIGRLGDDCDIEEGKRVARVCGINVLAQVNDAVKGKLETVRCVRLGVFVNATADFTAHPSVANGVSDLMVEVLGERGRHARFAVGVAGLPFGVAVEVDAVFEVE
jgi:enamine deaminase RidA (YjgF/YER057c/UK114 family)